MSDLFHFLTDLAVNPKQQLALATLPATMMDTIDLSESDKILLKNRNSAKIRAAFADSSFQAATAVADPNPDPLPDPDPPRKTNQMRFALNCA